MKNHAIRHKPLNDAHFEARKHKRWKTNTLQFSLNSATNVKILAGDITVKKYRIKPSLCFIAFAPIKREIFAGDFRDRIVHHLLFEELNQHYDQLLINDCYSCRRHKGTSYGIKRITHFLRAATKNHTKPAYILKLDISGYFMNIKRQKLYQINKKLIKNHYQQDPEKINRLLYLLRLVIFNDPTKNHKMRGHSADWAGLPKNKSLFYAPPGAGMPIGNLTSQLFGNIYLNDFDHFVKEKLKCHYYGRYVDDMVFIHQDREFLQKLIPIIDNYLWTRLGLKLHPKKIYLQPATNGLKFLGVMIKPHRIYIGQRIKTGFYQKIKLAAEGKISNPAFFNSYLGLMKKYDTFRLRRKIMTAPLTKRVLHKFNLHVKADFSQVLPHTKIGQDRPD